MTSDANPRNQYDPATGTQTWPTQWKKLRKALMGRPNPVMRRHAVPLPKPEDALHDSLYVPPQCHPHGC